MSDKAQHGAVCGQTPGKGCSANVSRLASRSSVREGTSFALTRPWLSPGESTWTRTRCSIIQTCICPAESVIRSVRPSADARYGEFISAPIIFFDSAGLDAAVHARKHFEGVTS